MKARSRFAVLGAAAALATLGQVAASVPAIGGAVTVKATGNDTWSPASKTVGKGTKVVWKNPSGDDHDVTSYKGTWRKASSLSEGGSTSFTFRKAGTYGYRCSRHSRMDGAKCDGMCGKIVVR